MPAEEQDIARMLQELKSGQDQLSADIQWLLHTQGRLDERLGRVEASIVFRTLRSIGRAYSQRFSRPTAGYRAWRKRGGGGLPSAAPEARPRFTLLVHPDDREAVSKSVENYGNCEVIATSWEEGLALSTGGYVAQIGEHDRVYPGALEQLASAAPADLLYSDEERLDAAGQPAGPLLKPDWSPVLLRSVDYLGGLTAIRRELALGHGDIRSAIRALPNLKAAHIPAILYGSRRTHLQPPPTTPVPAANGKLVSIIVCTRTAHLLDLCLKSIRERTNYSPFEVIVVQHLGSSNRSEESAVASVISAHTAKRVLYPAPFNFAKMNNLGAESASGSVLLFLNDDVSPLEPNWLLRLSAWLDDPSIGVVGAKLTFPDGTLQHAGIAAGGVDGAWHPGRNRPASANWPWLQYTREVSAVTGACLAIRAVDFHGLHGFDPQFPVNFNDVDLCFRMQAEGLSVILDVESKLCHDESRTRSAGSAYNERHLFFRKWSSRLERHDPFFTPHLAQNNEELTLR